MKFTFETPNAEIAKLKSKGLSTVKADNEAGILYNFLRKNRSTNVRFKPAFISTLGRRNYSGPVDTMLAVYKKTGSLKCSCCNSSEAYFVLERNKSTNTASFRAMVDTDRGPQALTVDHDLLKSLGGMDSGKNYNPMCYDCNQVRGNRFAEFKEFKEWYDAQETIDKVKGLPDPNFCYVDFKSNIANGAHTKLLHGAKVLPQEVIDRVMKDVRSGNMDVTLRIPMRLWAYLDRDFANGLLNRMVYERVYYGFNIKDVGLRQQNFFTNNIGDHRKLNLHIEKMIKSEIKKYRTLHNAAVQKAPVAEPAVQKVQKKKFSLKGFFAHIAKYFA